MTSPKTTAFLLIVMFLYWSHAGIKDWNQKQYHQLGYDITLDIVRILDYNRDVIRDPRVDAVFHNRTTRVLNGSAWLLRDCPSRDHLRVRFQVFRFVSNEYRYFPMDIEINPCEEWDRNLFNIQELAANMSNVRECPPKKGFYWVKQGKPQIEKLPPFIPTGSYRSLTTAYYGKCFLGQAEAFGRVVDTSGSNLAKKPKQH